MIISPARDAIFIEKCLPTFNSPTRDGIIEKWLIFISLKLVQVCNLNEKYLFSGLYVAISIAVC